MSGRKHLRHGQDGLVIHGGKKNTILADDFLSLHSGSTLALGRPHEASSACSPRHAATSPCGNESCQNIACLRRGPVVCLTMIAMVIHREQRKLIRNAVVGDQIITIIGVDSLCGLPFYHLGVAPSLRATTPWESLCLPSVKCSAQCLKPPAVSSLPYSVPHLLEEACS